MPMNDKVLSNDILKLFRANMKTLHPQAEPKEFQEKLAVAVAKGVISVIKASKSITIIVAPTTIGKDGIGLTVSAAIMKNTAILSMKAFIGGQGGIALVKMMDAIMTPISAHLIKNVAVKSITGFGGQGGPPVGAIAPAFEAAILKELPADIRKRMLQSKQGLFLVKSISQGLAAGMLTAVPGIVPVSTSTSTGLMTATFS